MSVSALLRGIHGTLVDDTSLDQQTVGVHENGQPPIAFPTHYAAIHLITWRPHSPPVDTGLYEKYDIAVTVTRRIPAVRPGKSMTDFFLTQITGMEEVVREINVAIDKNYDLIKRASLNLHNDRDWIFEPLRWAGTTSPEVRDANWLWSTAKENQACLVCTSTFVGAGRDMREDYEE